MEKTVAICAALLNLFLQQGMLMRCALIHPFVVIRSLKRRNVVQKDLITMRRGRPTKLRVGTGMLRAIYSHTKSILYFNTAEIGIIGALSATVPATNFLICSYWASAASGFTRSTLFCRIIIKIESVFQNYK